VQAPALPRDRSTLERFRVALFLHAGPASSQGRFHHRFPPCSSFPSEEGGGRAEGCSQSLRYPSGLLTWAASMQHPWCRGRTEPRRASRAREGGWYHEGKCRQEQGSPSPVPGLSPTREHVRGHLGEPGSTRPAPRKPFSLRRKGEHGFHTHQRHDRGSSRREGRERRTAHHSRRRSVQAPPLQATSGENPRRGVTWFWFQL